MPKIAKRFLIISGGVVLAAALLLLCINLYLQSSGVQQRIRDNVTKNLGTDIKIGGTLYTPWEGLVLKDLSIPDPTRPGSMIVEATALRVKFALFPLLEQRFVITEATLFEPRLVVRQLETGDWMVPLPAKLPKTQTVEKPATAKVAGPVLRAEVEKIRLRGGTVVFLDAKGQTVLTLEKAEIEAQVAADQTATGTFSVSRANVAGYLKPKRIEGPFSWDGQALNLPQIAGSMAGGKLQASYHLAILPEPKFDLQASVNEVSLKKLFAEANFDASRTEGDLNGTLQLSGDPRASDSTVGTGHFELLRAKLRPVDFLVQIGQVLQVNELQLLQLSDANIDLSVKDQKVWVDDIFLKSENLILRGQGFVRFKGKMDINAKLMVNRKLQQQLRAVMGKNFVQSEDPEYREVKFEVTGKIDSPKTDLVEKVIGINIGQDMGGLLRGLFRSPTPSKPKEN